MTYPMFRFQWPWMTLNLDFKVIIDGLDVMCTQLTRDLFAIAKFLFIDVQKPFYVFKSCQFLRF